MLLHVSCSSRYDIIIQHGKISVAKFPYLCKEGILEVFSILWKVIDKIDINSTSVFTRK